MLIISLLDRFRMNYINNNYYSVMGVSRQRLFAILVVKYLLLFYLFGNLHSPDVCAKNGLLHRDTSTQTPVMMGITLNGLLTPMFVFSTCP